MKQADETTLRLSLILSGAISLGAYEAGVVSQIAYALSKWNTPKEGDPDTPPPVIIDIISGASAGAMTGAMLAAHLMYGGEPEEFVRANEQTWCSQDTSFDRQLEFFSKEDKRHAFLSSQRLEQIAERYFRPHQRDRKRVRQEELIFTCTLTPLEKIPYSYTYITAKKGEDGLSASDSRLGATQNDWVTFSLMPMNPVLDAGGQSEPSVVELAMDEAGYPATREEGTTHPASLERLKAFALASGAFPIAWQPMQIARYHRDYPSPVGDEENPDFFLRYSDGGVLDNLPLNRAADVESALLHPMPAADRTYIIIEPDPEDPVFKGGSPRKPVDEFVPHRDDSGLPYVANSVYEALREQSFDRDLRASQKVNLRLRAREEFVPKNMCLLIEGIPEENEAKEQLKEVQGQLVELFQAKEDVSYVDKRVKRYCDSLSKTGKTYTLYGEMLKKSQTHGALYLYSMVLADSIAGLADKSLVRIGRVFPGVNQESSGKASSTLAGQSGTAANGGRPVLAGDKLGHFGGFLDPAFMLYDFVQGLHDAHNWLKQMRIDRIEEIEDKFPSLFDFWPEPANAAVEMGYDVRITPDIKELALRGWDQLPHSMRERFTDQFIGRGADFIADEVKQDDKTVLFIARFLVWIVRTFLKYQNWFR